MNLHLTNEKDRVRRQLESLISAVSRRGPNARKDDPATREARALLGFQSRTIADMEFLSAHLDDLQQQFSARQKPQTGLDTAGFQSFGEQLAAIRRAGLNNSIEDPRLRELERRSIPAGNSTRYPSEGGFLIAPAFSMALLDRIMYQSVVASRALDIPIGPGKNGACLPGIDEQSRVDGSRWGGIFARWLAEGDSLPASKPRYRNVELSLKKLAAIFYSTDELLLDTGVLGAWAYRGLSLEAAWRWDDACLNGDGAGKPQGIMGANCLVTVAKDVGQIGGLTASNVTGMFGRMLPEARAGAVWFVTPEAEESLYTLPLSVGTGGSQLNLFTPADESAPFGRLMNRPIVPCEQCANFGTTGDIVFANMDYYLTIQRPVDIASSIHVRFNSDENAWRMTFRTDSGPALATPITPFNGGPTKSAFVALQSR